MCGLPTRGARILSLENELLPSARLLGFAGLLVDEVVGYIVWANSIGYASYSSQQGLQYTEDG